MGFSVVSQKNKKRERRSSRSFFLMLTAIIGIVAMVIILASTDFREMADFFKNTTFLFVVLFVLIQISLMIVLTLRWATILVAQGHKNINLFRLNKYRLAGQAVSFFTPAAKLGGEGIKTRIMSRRESLPYSKALSSVVLDNSVDLTASGFFFFVGAVIVISVIKTSSSTKLFLGALVFLFLLSLGFFNYRLFKGKTLIHGLARKLGFFKFKKLRRIESDIKRFDKYLHDFYKKDKKYFFYSMTLSFFSWVLMFLEYYVAGRLLGLNFSVWMIFLIVTLVGVAYLIPVPMALGTLEAGQLSAFSILGISAAAGIGLSFIIRAKDLLIAFIGVGIMSFYGFDINQALEKQGFGDEENGFEK